MYKVIFTINNYEGSMKKEDSKIFDNVVHMAEFILKLYDHPFRAYYGSSDVYYSNIRIETKR